MNHKQRIAAVLAGQTPDRLPVSVWGHDFLREWSAEDLAAQTIETYRTYDYDFVKINPRWTLFAEPWGNRYEPPTEQRFPRLTHRCVSAATDMAVIPQVSAQHRVFCEHVSAVRRVTNEIGDEVDCIATLFSPLAVLGLLAGGLGEPLLTYLQEEPQLGHQALEHITETLSDHAKDLLDAGASGIFYAPLQWTSLDVCSASSYKEFGRPYDFELLNKVSNAPMNMLHVCGDDIEMHRFYDYPVQILNWDNFGVGNPSLKEVAEASNKIVAGGIPHKALHKLNDTGLLDRAAEALDGLNAGVMLAGGCGIGAMTPPEPRSAVVRVAQQLC